MNGLKDYAINTGYNVLFVLSFLSLWVHMYILPVTLAYVAENAYGVTAGGLFDTAAQLWVVATWVWVVFGVYIAASFLADIGILINQNLAFEKPADWIRIIQSDGICGIAKRRP